MAFTPSINLVNEFSKSTVKPVYLVEIHEDATTSHKFVSSTGTTITAAHALLSDVSPVAAQMDPVERDYTSGGLRFSLLDDAVVTALFNDQPMMNKRVDISIGGLANLEGDYQLLGFFMIADHFYEDGAIQVECNPAVPFMLAQKPITGVYINKHPLEILEDLITRTGVPAAYYDSASFDPTDAAWSDTQHWNISRYAAESVVIRGGDNPGRIDIRPAASSINQEHAADLFTDLSKVITASFRPNDNGEFSILRYDATGASVRTLTADDISGLRHISSTEHQFSEVSIEFSADERGDAPYFSFKETNSRADLNKFPGVSGTVFNASHKITTKWLNSFGSLLPDRRSVANKFVLEPNDTTFFVQYAGISGFSGCDYPTAVTEPAAAQQLSASQPGYLLLRYLGKETRLGALPATETTNKDHEVIKVTGCQNAHVITFGSQDWFKGTILDVPSDPDGTLVSLPSASLFTIADPSTDREQFSSNPTEYWKQWTEVYDVTIAVEMMQKRLERSMYGIPKIEMMLSMKHIDLQVGDIVQVTHPEMLFYRVTGSDSGVFWEVVETEIRAFDDSPGIRVVLAKQRGVNTSQASFPAVDTVFEPEGILIDFLPSTPNNIVTDNDLDPVWVANQTVYYNHDDTPSTATSLKLIPNADDFLAGTTGAKFCWTCWTSFPKGFGGLPTTFFDKGSQINIVTAGSWPNRAFTVNVENSSPAIETSTTETLSWDYDTNYFIAMIAEDGAAQEIRMWRGVEGGALTELTWTVGPTWPADVRVDIGSDDFVHGSPSTAAGAGGPRPYHLSDIVFWVGNTITEADLTDVFGAGPDANLSSKTYYGDISYRWRFRDSTVDPGVDATFTEEIAGSAGGIRNISGANKSPSSMQRSTPQAGYCTSGASGAAYFACGDDNTLEALTDCTWAWWSWVGTAETITHDVLTRSGNTDATTSFLFQMLGSGDANRKLRCSINEKDGTNYGETSAGTFTPGWLGIVVVYTSGGAANADRLKVYFDAGAESLTFAGTISSAALRTHNEEVYIFNRDDGASTGPASEMRMSNLTIWNTAMDATQVSELNTIGRTGNMKTHSLYPTNILHYMSLADKFDHYFGPTSAKVQDANGSDFVAETTFEDLVTV